MLRYSINGSRQPNDAPDLGTSTCVKGEQCPYSGLYIGYVSEARYTNGRYSISLGASKRFLILRKKYLGGGVLGMF